MVAPTQEPIDAIERRSSERAPVKCPAVMRTPYSTVPGELSDISTGGARFEAPEVPGPGINVLLEWDDYEAFCRVVWSKHDACGVAFDEPIPASAVSHTVEHTHRTEPAAEVGKIPLGTRRNRMGPAMSGGEGEAR